MKAFKGLKNKLFNSDVIIKIQCKIVAMAKEVSDAYLDSKNIGFFIACSSRVIAEITFILINHLGTQYPYDEFSCISQWF